MEANEIRSILGDSVWSEDDSGCHDREKLYTALPRLTGLSGDRKKRHPLEVVDDGNYTWEIYKDWIVCCSYPEQTSIFKRKK